MQTKFALKDCPLIFIYDDLINAGLGSDYDPFFYGVFSYGVIRGVIRSKRREYFGFVLDDTHGALAKLFAAADAGEVTDPEQLAVVNWLRADGGDVIESYRLDDKCKPRDVYRAAIKLAQLALACQVCFDAGKSDDDVEYTQYYIECLRGDDEIDWILDSACSLAEQVGTKIPRAHDRDCMVSILKDMPYNLSLCEMYMQGIYDLTFTDLDEIMNELRQYY